MKKILWILIISLALVTSRDALAAGVSTYDDLLLDPESYWTGADGSGGFYSGGNWHENSYTDWGGGYYSWSGFSYSNRTDLASRGTEGQYTAYNLPSGGGVQGSSNYSVGFVELDWMTGTYDPVPITATLADEGAVSGAYFTNNAYTYWTMLEGDPYGFTDPFGLGDWLLLTITGYLEDEITGTVDFYLADYRSENSDDWYIVDTWIWVSLAGLGPVTSLDFVLTGSDTGEYGLNTPAYFAMDSLNYSSGGAPVPIPAAIWLLGSGLVGLMGLRRKLA